MLFQTFSIIVTNEYDVNKDNEELELEKRNPPFSTQNQRPKKNVHNPMLLRRVLICTHFAKPPQTSKIMRRINAMQWNCVAPSGREC